MNFNEQIVGNNYKVCYTCPYKDIKQIIYGKIQNFNQNGNVVVYVEDSNSSMGLYIIPYNCIEWMFPNGLSKQFKDKIGCNFEKTIEMYNGYSIDEIQKTFINNIYKQGDSVGSSLLKTCKQYDIYFSIFLYSELFQNDFKRKRTMHDYIKKLDSRGYIDKGFWVQ